MRGGRRRACHFAWRLRFHQKRCPILEIFRPTFNLCMPAIDFSPIQTHLERMQDDTLSRRDRDASRRLVVKWLNVRDLDLAAPEGLVAIGRWDDPQTRTGRFHPEHEALEDGTTEPWKDEAEDLDEAVEEEEQRLTDEKRRELRAELEKAIDACRGSAGEAGRLADLLARMDDVDWMQGRSWADQDEIFEPLLARLLELGEPTLSAVAAEFPADSEAARHLLHLLHEWAQARPEWAPDEELDDLLLDFRFFDDDDEAWEHGFEVLARAKSRVDDHLRRILMRRGATFTDVNWGSGVLNERGDEAAYRLAREAIETWRKRERFDFIELLADRLLPFGGPSDADYLMAIVREGVAEGEDMLETWSHVSDFLNPLEAHEMVQSIRERGIDPQRLRTAVTCGPFAGARPGLQPGSDGTP